MFYFIEVFNKATGWQKVRPSPKLAEPYKFESSLAAIEAAQSLYPDQTRVSPWETIRIVEE